MNQRNSRRRGGRYFRGGYSNQNDGAPGPSGQRPKMGFQSVMRRNFPDNDGTVPRNFLHRLGVPVRGGGGPRGRGLKHMPHIRHVEAIDSNWSRVQVVRGRNYGKEFLIQQLRSSVDGKFHPVLFKTTPNGDVTFLVDDVDVAEAIRAVSRRIVAPNGQKLIINVTPTTCPYMPLVESDVEILKKVLDQRYDAVNNHMNLSDFINTPGIDIHGNHLSLNRNNVMMTIVSLLGDACPTLKSIDVSKNKLRQLEYFGCLNFRCPNIVSVSLASNMVDNVDELEKFSFWDLTALDLDENPLCKNYRDKTSYINAIKKYFPSITRLDGSDLRPAFKTGIEEAVSATMPIFKESFLVNDTYKQICGPFIAQYFSIFDDKDTQQRQNLLEAYDTDATFTFSAVHLTNESRSMSNRVTSWQELMRNSHNIKRMDVWSSHRSKMIQKGKLAVVSFFCSHFPATHHDPTSFIMDVSLATEELACLNVNGLLKVNASDSDPWLYFTRVFLLVPKNNGVAIINDEMFVSTISPNEERQYRAQLESVKMTSSVADQSSSMSTNMGGVMPVQQGVAVPVSIPTEPAISKEILTTQFAQLTKMRPEWAEKCLHDCQWNFEQAAQIFNELIASNSIPQEAFQ